MGKKTRSSLCPENISEIIMNTFPKWFFPSCRNGVLTGISGTHLETFKDNPIKSLASEICQNSLDARIANGNPVRVEFKLFEISATGIPGCSDLRDYISKAKKTLGSGAEE